MSKHLLCVLSVIMATIMLIGCGGGGGGSNPSGSNTDDGNCSITGRVSLAAMSDVRSSKSSNGIADAKIYLEELPGFSTMSRADGSYTLSGFPKGIYRIVAKYESNGSVFKMRTGSIEIKEDKNIDEIAVKEAKNKIVGCIKDETGNYLPKGTKLSLWGEEFAVGESGEFITPPLPELTAEESLNDIIVVTENKRFILPVAFTSDLNATRVSCVVSNTTGAVTSLNVGPNLDIVKYYGIWDLTKEIGADNKETNNPLTDSYIKIEAYGANSANFLITKSYAYPSYDYPTGEPFFRDDYVSTFTCCLEGDILRLTKFWGLTNYTFTDTVVIEFQIDSLTTGYLRLKDPNSAQTEFRINDNTMTIIDAYGVTRQLKKREK